MLLNCKFISGISGIFDSGPMFTILVGDDEAWESGEIGFGSAGGGVDVVATGEATMGDVLASD